jgi:hypothetical protein
MKRNKEINETPFCELGILTNGPLEEFKKKKKKKPCSYDNII